MCCGVLFLGGLMLGVLLCTLVYVMHKMLHFVGWFVLAWWLAGVCDSQLLLWRWLAFYQAATLAELFVCGVTRMRRERIEEALDGCTRRGFTKACLVVNSMLLTGLKVFWCIHMQALVAATPVEPHCGHSLPRFMAFFTVIILLQMLLVEPMMKLGTRLSYWLAVMPGSLQLARGARPGTLESMQVVEYDASLFADTDEPSDARPQGECCFCLEEYCEDAVIVKTPCGHYMHKECLSRWLQTSYLCPICRGDLESQESSV
jgi:hypothetical protein